MINRLDARQENDLAQVTVQQVTAPPADGATRMWWLGGATFVVRTATTALWVDPFFGPPARPVFHRQYPPLLDSGDIDVVSGVLITHEHNDHCHLPTLSTMAAENPSFPTFAPSVSAEKIRAELTNLPVTVAGAGYEGSVGDISFSVHAGNDPMADEGVMFVLQTPAGKLFLAGDSLYSQGFFADFKQENIDIACFSVGELLFGEKAYMAPLEFGMAAEEIGAAHAVPVHWDLWEEAKVDPNTVSDWGTSSLLLWKPGEGAELRAKPKGPA